MASSYSSEIRQCISDFTLVVVFNISGRHSFQCLSSAKCSVSPWLFMQTWNKEQRRTLANTFILAGQLGVLKCLNTRHYLFIFLIEVFDLKVVDAEWCFDLPTKLENILLPRNLIRYQRACYENIHNGCLADTYTAIHRTNTSKRSERVSLSSGQDLVGFVIGICVDISSSVLWVVYCLRARAVSGPAFRLTAPALFSRLG